jgi:hypothetical protein
MSTKRTFAKRPYCECESPICTEARVKYIEGSITSRSDWGSSSASFASVEEDEGEEQGDERRREERDSKN